MKASRFYRDAFFCAFDSAQAPLCRCLSEAVDNHRRFGSCNKVILPGRSVYDIR
jgi:hypothetical protein